MDRSRGNRAANRSVARSLILSILLILSRSFLVSSSLTASPPLHPANAYQPGIGNLMHTGPRMAYPVLSDRALLLTRSRTLLESATMILNGSLLRRGWLLASLLSVAAMSLGAAPADPAKPGKYWVF